MCQEPTELLWIGCLTGLFLILKFRSGGQENWRPQGMPETRGGGPARVPNLRVCKHLSWVWYMQENKGELRSCLGTVQSAWQKPPVRRKTGRTGLPARVSGRHVVRR